MAKMIGLSRNLKLPWLNQIVELTSGELKENEIKEKLDKYLSFEIGSPTNIRKTREILMRIWYYDNNHAEKLRPEARRLLNKYPEFALQIHWCMMLATYPVFVDMCKLIGKMFEFQDVITPSNIRQKLFDEWGERTTLYYSIEKLLSTLKAFDVFICDKPGKYHVKTHGVDRSEVCTYMVYVMMNVDNNGYYPFQEINTSEYFFPFEYRISKEDILEDERFVISNLGGELSISLKE